MKKAIFYVYSLLLCCELLLSLGDPTTHDGWHGLVSSMVDSILAMPWTLIALPVTLLLDPVFGKKTDTLFLILLWIGILANWIILFRFSHKK